MTVSNHTSNSVALSLFYRSDVWRRFALALSVLLLGSGAQVGSTSIDQSSPQSIQALDCIIEPSVVVDLGAATPGVIASLKADRSDYVEAGEVVAELESEVERATLQLAKVRAGLTTALELRETNLKFGESQQDRRRELLARNLLSQEDYERLETEADIARLQAREAQDNRRLASLEYQRAYAAFARRQIRSPVAGLVVERYKSPGEYVEDQPVIRIANIDTLHVEILAPVELLGQVRPGMTAQVELQPARLGTHSATVTRVDQVVDAASGTFGVRLELANPDRHLPGGLRCVANLDSVNDPEPIANSALAKGAATAALVRN